MEICNVQIFMSKYLKQVFKSDFDGLDKAKKEVMH